MCLHEDARGAPVDELQADAAARAAEGAAAWPRQPGQDRLKGAAEAGLKAWAAGPLPGALVEARIHSDWSQLGGGSPIAIESDPGRSAVQEQLAGIIEAVLAQPEEVSGRSL